MDINQNIAAAWYNYGFLHARNNDKEAALAAYKKAILCDPEFYSAYFHMGIIYEFIGNFLEAKKCLDIFIKKYPSYVPAQKLLQKISDNLN